MQAIVLAGGAGSRLRPLTNEIPKPMVKMLDKPILYYIIGLLKKHGFTDVRLTLNYKSEVITDYFKSGNEFGVKLTYYVEDEPLGTAGSVKAAGDFTDENFLVISGDAFTEIDLTDFYRAHARGNAIGTLAVKEVENPRGFGVVKTENGIIREFVEKPLNPTNSLVNTGIYMFKRDILQYIPDGFYDFGRDLFPRLTGKLAAYETDAYWSDIGTLKSYYGANLYLVEKMEKQGVFVR